MKRLEIFLRSVSKNAAFLFLGAVLADRAHGLPPVWFWAIVAATLAPEFVYGIVLLIGLPKETSEMNDAIRKLTSFTEGLEDQAKLDQRREAARARIRAVEAKLPEIEERVGLPPIREDRGDSDPKGN